MCHCICFENARTVLSALEMEQEFDYIVDAAKITKSKPDPEIFVEACRGLGLETSEVVELKTLKLELKQ